MTKVGKRLFTLGFALLVAQHDALRFGAQIHRRSQNGPGIYAFSRIERDEQVEYVVAVNNSETARRETFDTFSPDTRFEPVWGGGGARRTAENGNITVRVPALSAVVLKAKEPIPESRKASRIAAKITAPEQGSGPGSGRHELSARLSGRKFAEVTFAVKVGDGRFEHVGTDDNAPYRVFCDADGVRNGARITVKATVNDLNGRYRSDTARTTIRR